MSFFHRFHTYETQTMPIIQHYEKLGLVKKIQAIKSPEQVRCCTCSFASMVNGAFEFRLQIDLFTHMAAILN